MENSQTSKPKVVTIFGTRPEAIKLFPVIRALSKRSGLQNISCVTAQHRQMLDQVLDIADIVPDHDMFKSIPLDERADKARGLNNMKVESVKIAIE